jgi:dihydrofolate synthase/folylpolyglutamate synthase
LRTGAYTSPHVSGWSERIQVDGRDVDIEAALARVRETSERLGATQFEVLTAAALLEFAEAHVDVAVVEAGLGGRLDATNVLDAKVVLLTNVALDHTAVLGETRVEIAREKLAVAGPDAVVVLGEPEWAGLVPSGEVREGGAREAAEAFLGGPIEQEVDVQLPGRLELRGNELRDGAHNPAGVEWLVDRLPHSDYVLCVSILADKDIDAMLRGLSRAGDVLVATQSSNPRALLVSELGRRAVPYFRRVEAIADPAAALRRARELAGPQGQVLVTGSLYLLADLSASEARAYDEAPW